MFFFERYLIPSSSPSSSTNIRDLVVFIVVVNEAAWSRRLRRPDHLVGRHCVVLCREPQCEPRFVVASRGSKPALILPRGPSRWIPPQRRNRSTPGREFRPHLCMYVYIYIDRCILCYLTLSSSTASLRRHPARTHGCSRRRLYCRFMMLHDYTMIYHKEILKRARK